VKLKSTVRSLIVVMVDVLVQHPLEVTQATNDHPVQALAAGGPHPALGMGVGFGSLKRCSDHPHTFPSQHVLEGERELLVVVTDQEPGSGTLLLEPPGKVSRLLADPVLGRMLGHAKP
jgi:hypothetical protein